MTVFRVSTAPTPPLSTAGYGRAPGRLAWFVRARYLSSSHCVFIAFATADVTRVIPDNPAARLDEATHPPVVTLVLGAVGAPLFRSVTPAYRLLTHGWV
ncbi:DUF389 domain-containing protein, partial [Burkholderia cenocepacia]